MYFLMTDKGAPSTVETKYEFVHKDGSLERSHPYSCLKTRDVRSFHGFIIPLIASNTIPGSLFTRELGVAYIPMPKGMGIAPHVIMVCRHTQILKYEYADIRKCKNKWQTRRPEGKQDADDSHQHHMSRRNGTGHVGDGMRSAFRRRMEKGRPCRQRHAMPKWS